MKAKEKREWWDKLSEREQLDFYRFARPSAKAELLWNEQGTWDPVRDESGRLIEVPHKYWCPVLRFGGKGVGVIGRAADGSKPVGHRSRAAAIAAAVDFQADARRFFAEKYAAEAAAK